MKHLNNAPLSNSAQFFPKKGTLEFLQLAHKETAAATMIALIGSSYSTSTVYVLYGVVNSSVAPIYTISAGWVFYNGEFYEVAAVNFTATGSDVAVFSLITSQYTTDADPCTFGDTTSHNIHDIRKLQLTAGAPGSGIANIAQAFYLHFAIPAQLNLTASGQAVLSGVYPNLNVDVPASANPNPILFAGSYNVGNVPAIGSGGGTYAVSFGTTLPTANYYIMGSIISNGGSSSNDTTVVWSVHNRLDTGFTLNVQEFTAATQNIAFEYIIFAK